MASPGQFSHCKATAQCIAFLVSPPINDIRQSRLEGKYLMKKINRYFGILIFLSSFSIFNFQVSAEEAIEREKKTPEAVIYNQSKSRVYIFRKSTQLVLGGVSASIGGRKYASLGKREFDVFEYKTGEVIFEIGQNLNFELCKVKINIEPLRDNYLLIKDRDAGVARKFFFNNLIFQALERSSSGECSGLNEVIEISKEEAEKEFDAFTYSPIEAKEDGIFSNKSVCADINKGLPTNSCDITYGAISKVRPTKYVSDSIVVGYTAPPPIMVRCKIGDNPEIDLDADACVKVKGTIQNQEGFLCVLGKNTPIKLTPELCLSGSGRIVRQ